MKVSYTIRTLDDKIVHDGFVEDVEPDADVLMHLIWNNGRMFVHETFVKFMLKHDQDVYKIRLMLDDKEIFDVEYALWKNLPELMNKLHLDDIIFLTMRGMTLETLIDYSESPIFATVSNYVNTLK